MWPSCKLSGVMPARKLPEFQISRRCGKIWMLTPVAAPQEVGFELLLGDAGHGELSAELNTKLNTIRVCV